MTLHRHVNPDGSLGGLIEGDLSPDMWLLYEDEAKRLADKLPTLSERIQKPMTTQEYDELIRRSVLSFGKRLFAGTIAQKLFPIQPMSQPTGAIFYMEYKYGESLKETKLKQKRKGRKK